MLAALAVAGLLGGLLPPATAAKTVTVVSDPVNGTVAPKAIPGAMVDYTILVTNASGAAVDSGSIAVVDAIPAQAKLFVGDLGVAGSGPVAFNPTGVLAGFAYTDIALGSTSDDVDFSNDGGANWTYIPAPGTDGCDAAVNAIRIHPHGIDPIAGVFSVRFRVKLR